MQRKKFFIEVGSCDFDTLLPLAKQGWKGILVEPIKYYLDRLERIDGVEYENSAIAAQPGTYCIKYWDPKAIGDKKNGNYWMRGCGTLRFTAPIFEANPSWDSHIITEHVPGITLDQLIEKYGVKYIDYLKIDVEGVEEIILSNYSWKTKPTAIRVEHVHSDKKNLKHILVNQGYIVYEERNDLYAIG